MSKKAKKKDENITQLESKLNLISGILVKQEEAIKKIILQGNILADAIGLIELFLKKKKLINEKELIDFINNIRKNKMKPPEVKKPIEKEEGK